MTLLRHGRLWGLCYVEKNGLDHAVVAGDFSGCRSADACALSLRVIQPVSTSRWIPGQEKAFSPVDLDSFIKALKSFKAERFPPA